MSNIVGIDLGTLKAALVCIGSAGITKEDFIYSSKEHSVKERFSLITKGLLDALDRYAPKTLVVEYPFNIKGNAKVLLEMFGVIRYWAAQRGIEFYGVPQTSLKKYATGDGRASKEAMVKALADTTRLNWGEDAADAYWAARIGLDYRFVDAVTDKHRLAVINRMRKAQL